QVQHFARAGPPPDGGSGGPHESWGRPRVLKEEELRSMEAALSWLAPLLSALAVCLDVWLPFPVHRGRAALGTEAAAGAPERRRGRTAGSAAARIGPCKWTSPCVEHPFTARWNYFSIYDGICTSEFATATRLLDEDLRHLCACQGELVSPETG
ncbi:unnamed protein product, partial [Prorocentrum cordatum]